MSFFFTSGLRAAVAFLLLATSLQLGDAQVRSSSNYQLQSDSISDGGRFSSSTNYQHESTVGDVATGESDSTSYSLRAGYQQMQEVFISLAGSGDITLDAILGITGGTSNGTSTLVVTTDSPSGYNLFIRANDSPAMQGSGSVIADYNHGTEPDFTFMVGSSDAYFGYTPSGTDIDDYFRDVDGVCNSGSGDTAFRCWAGLSMIPRTVAQSSGSNHPTGATTTINFRVVVGPTAGVIAGVYTATTTITALPL